MKTITIATLFAAALLLAGCNTVRGMGQDIQKAGEKIEDATKKK
jgi:predicted small secreted protein